MGKILPKFTEQVPLGSEFAPAEVSFQERKTYEFLSKKKQETTPDPVEDETLAVDREIVATLPSAPARGPSRISESVEQRLGRELEALPPTVIGRLFSNVLKRTHPEKVEVLLSGLRLVLSVVGVSISPTGMSFLVPKDTAFEPDLGLEFDLMYRNQRYSVISVNSPYPFPGLDFNVASFMFVNTDTQ